MSIHKTIEDRLSEYEPGKTCHILSNPSRRPDKSVAVCQWYQRQSVSKREYCDATNKILDHVDPEIQSLDPQIDGYTRSQELKKK